MKFKCFALCCMCFVFICLYIIVFERKRQVIEGLVSETHKQFNSLRNFKQDLHEASEKLLNVDKKYLINLGFDEADLNQPSYVHGSQMNTIDYSSPTIVTYVDSDLEDQAISFARNIASLLPKYHTVMYNIGLRTSELFLLRSFCNNYHCSIVDFNLDEYPSHVKSDKSLFRPLIIQDALNNLGGVFFIDCNLRLITSDIQSLIDRAQRNGILVWQSKYPTTTITHPKMFEYFRTNKESFYFVPAVDSSKMIVFNTTPIHKNVMLSWIKCVLVRNCILPIASDEFMTTYLDLIQAVP